MYLVKSGLFWISRPYSDRVKPAQKCKINWPSYTLSWTNQLSQLLKGRDLIRTPCAAWKTRFRFCRTRGVQNSPMWRPHKLQCTPVLVLSFIITKLSRPPYHHRTNITDRFPGTKNLLGVYICISSWKSVFP